MSTFIKIHRKIYNITIIFQCMNLKNKYLMNTIRIVFGLLMIFSGIGGFLMGKNTEGVPEIMAEVTKALWNSGIFQMIKITEIIAGAMLVLNFLPALAVIFIAPIVVGIVIFNYMLSPSYIFFGLILTLIEIYFIYIYWNKYKPIFEKN